MTLIGKVLDRVKREVKLVPLISKGYSRKIASDWYEIRKKDIRKHQKAVSKPIIKQCHKCGFTYSTVKKYKLPLETLNSTEYISDFDYYCLRPFNSTFSKWIDDILTSNKILLNHQDVCRKVFFSIVQRNGNTLILPVNGSEKRHSVEDIVKLVVEQGAVELRPSFWKSKRPRYSIRYEDGKLLLDGRNITNNHFRLLIESLRANYIISEPISLKYELEKDRFVDHTIKFWLANDSQNGTDILEAVMNLYYSREKFENGRFKSRRIHECSPISLEDGCFNFDGQNYFINGWDKIQEKVKAISTSLGQLNYYAMSISCKEDGLFTIVYFDAIPALPELCYGTKLNCYLKSKASKKQHILNNFGIRERIKEITGILFDKWVKRFCRKGIRPYMQKIWCAAVKDDLLHTKGATLKQKIWCWRHGFFSWRIWQYGVNEHNCKNFLSDYDYCWLNRINNDYQKWVNDKTTYRIIMDPYSQFLPKYYFSVFSRNNNTDIIRMIDCPNDIKANSAGILELLKREGKLAFKPSAGTHGDGFYCLAYDGSNFLVNGKISTPEDLIDVIENQKSFYIVTEYLVMHEMLRDIYPGSVNTIRVMVVNEHGNDPKIMQTYMRIGSNSTGFTDNVGYGGICVMINKDTGELYTPQTISNHVFHDCPVHPDTNTQIAGILPNWQILRESILAASRYLGELEYLGFDVVITKTGICILEINIHQDLHKVNEFTPEMNEFFNRKISRKKRSLGI